MKGNKFIIVMFFIFTLVSMASTAVIWKRIDEITENTDSLSARLVQIEDVLKNGSSTVDSTVTSDIPKKRIVNFEKKIKALEKLIQAKSLGAQVVSGASVATGVKSVKFCSRNGRSVNVIEFSGSKKLRSWEVEFLEEGEKRVGDKQEATYRLLGDIITITFNEMGLEGKKRGFVESIDENDEVVAFSVSGNSYSASLCPGLIN